MTTSIVLNNALAVLLLMAVLWSVSVIQKDASVVDPWWSMGFALVFVRTLGDGPITPGKLALGVPLVLWAVRLWAHLILRARGKGEDPRYTAMRERFGPARFWWVSIFVVFGLQGVLMLIISWPLALAAAAPAPDPLHWNDLAGAGLALFGLGFEATADWQLTRFRADASRRGQVLDSGLWGWSRHPNYFGETLVMWGLWLCAIDRPGGLYTAFAPALMTFMLLRVSGVTMLEEQLARTKPKYRDYVRRTSAFLPRPPRP